MDNLYAFNITAAIITVIVVVMHSMMFILFFRLFTFFLNYRKNITVSRVKRGKKDDGPSLLYHLTLYNKFIIGLIYFLFALSLLNLVTIVVD